MTRIIIGHSGYFPDDGKTFVPLGMRLHFHAEENHELKFHMAVQAVREAGSGRSVDSRGPGAKVNNYAMTAIDSFSMGNMLRATVKFAEPTFVGGGKVPSPIRLCDGDDKTCPPPRTPKSSDPGAPAPGRHHCTGLLALFADEPHLHLVACRVREGDDKPPVTKYTAGDKPMKDTSFFDDVQARRRKFLALIRRHPGAIGEFDKMPDEEQAYLLSDLRILRWWRLTHARKYIIANGKYAFYRTYVSDLEAKGDLDRHGDDVFKGHFNDVGYAISEVKKELAEFLNPATPEATRVEMWSQLHPDRDRPSFMALDPWIYEWAIHHSATSAQPLQWDEVDTHNASVLLSMENGGETTFWLHHDQLVIGHDMPYFQHVQEIAARPGHCEGRIRVQKPLLNRAGTTSSGTVHVRFSTGTADRASLELCMARLPQHVFEYELVYD